MKHDDRMSLFSQSPLGCQKEYPCVIMPLRASDAYLRRYENGISASRGGEARRQLASLIKECSSPVFHIYVEAISESQPRLPHRIPAMKTAHERYYAAKESFHRL